MVNINRILCPVDLSEFSRDALHHALALADGMRRKSPFFTSTVPLSRWCRLPGCRKTYPSRRRFNPTRSLKTCAGSAPLHSDTGESVEIVVREGNATKEIVLLAEQLPADLLVLGTHGRSGFERLFLGSVTEKVLRSTRVPVMTIPPPVTQPGPALYKTILCPLDFSDASTRALDYALSLAQEADARLILLHVIESLLGEAGASEMGHLSVSEYRPISRRGCGGTAQICCSRTSPCLVPPEERVTRGRAYREILKVAKDEGVELIVMGVQGKGALNRLVFGSTTHHVIREAGCPVLTIRG